MQVAPVVPAVVAPLSSASETFPTPPPDSPLPADRPELQNLRDLAARFVRERRYSLAAARLEDALELAPQDAELLVDYGSALYRLGRYDDAQRRFQSAIEALPSHVGALDGLALVAATQKRYPEARKHLQHLLRLQPESGIVWLRYGDIEHRLGNTAEALEAWEKALQVDDCASAVRTNAQRRLDYFGPKRTRGQP